MKDIIKDISELDNMSLSILMDEAVSASPRISFYRIKTKVEGHEQFTSALILCAAKGSSLYDEAVANDTTNKKTVPASQMRMRTIGATIRQTAGRMHDICCLTTEPDLYLLATINPMTIDYLESVMEDTMPTTQTSEGWEKSLSANEKALLNALNEWINKPLEPLITDALKASSGVSWDRVRVEDGQTIAILVAVHPKAEPWASRVQHYFQENRGNSIDSISGANFYLIMEEAFNMARQGLATIFVIRNPDVVLIASVAPDAIKKIEDDFL